MKTSRQRGAAHTGGTSLSHKVRIWGVRKNLSRSKQENAKQKKPTYTVRWNVDGVSHQSTFATRALAEAERSTLLAYANKGVAFDKVTGLPEPLLRERQARSWYEHVCAYVDMKWSTAAGNSRRSIAETVATVTPALIVKRRGMPDRAQIRRAMYEWVCVKTERDSNVPPADLARVIAWLQQNTVSLADLQDDMTGPDLVRSALDALSLKLDGTRAARNTITRKRAVLYNMLAYAVELRQLRQNPIDQISWKLPKAVESVDARVVVNRQQAGRLLDAVAGQGERGARMKAFFGCMYYAGLRPSEAVDLRRENLVCLPESGWGDLLLTASNPRAGSAWTDSGTSRERRTLKHRDRQETRSVPIHPNLAELLRAHLEQFGVHRDGRIFVGKYGGTFQETTYHAVWSKAREKAFSAAEYDSPLAARPYDLRHACASTWLNAGVAPTRVAQWLGHSVEVLLRVYAKCIDGHEDADRQRIERFMSPDIEP
ncbi:site-specific integrase [Actinopolymorpha sp. B11F2]|uniref:tyrosine-type recombinase/integrase n=1 Tax=Actinopolymorpha sp. B11F2 TaxID=3160862 RepID=UPI0032E52730